MAGVYQDADPEGQGRVAGEALDRLPALLGQGEIGFLRLVTSTLLLVRTVTGRAMSYPDVFSGRRLFIRSRGPGRGGLLAEDGRRERAGNHHHYRKTNSSQDAHTELGLHTFQWLDERPARPVEKECRAVHPRKGWRGFAGSGNPRTQRKRR